MERQIPRIMRMLQTTSDGDLNSLQTMGLQDGFEYDIPDRFNPETTTKKALEEQIDDLMFFAEAANRLHMNKSEIVARKAVSHMIHSYYCLYDRVPKIGGRYSGTDLANELLELAQTLCKGLDILKHLELLRYREETNEEASSSKGDEKSEQDSEQGSVYDPTNDGGSSTEDDTDDDDDDAASKKTRKPSLPPSPKRLKKDVSPSKSAAGLTLSDKPRSHHKKKTCPVPKCAFHGNDLRRHLFVHVRKGDLAEDAVDRLLSIVRAGHQQ